MYILRAIAGNCAPLFDPVNYTDGSLQKAVLVEGLDIGWRSMVNCVQFQRIDCAGGGGLSSPPG